MAILEIKDILKGIVLYGLWENIRNNKEIKGFC